HDAGGLHRAEHEQKKREHQGQHRQERIVEPLKDAIKVLGHLPPPPASGIGALRGAQCAIGLSARSSESPKNWLCPPRTLDLCQWRSRHAPSASVRDLVLFD